MRIFISLIVIGCTGKGEEPPPVTIDLKSKTNEVAPSARDVISVPGGQVVVGPRRIPPVSVGYRVEPKPDMHPKGRAGAPSVEPAPWVSMGGHGLKPASPPLPRVRNVLTVLTC